MCLSAILMSSCNGFYEQFCHGRRRRRHRVTVSWNRCITPGMPCISVDHRIECRCKNGSDPVICFSAGPSDVSNRNHGVVRAKSRSNFEVPTVQNADVDSSNLATC